MAGKDLVPIPIGNYAALQQTSGDLMETIEANLGGAKISEFDLDRVKIPSGGGKSWTVPTLEGEESKSELQGVIVAWKDTRVFWETSFEDQGGGQSPDCSSPDAKTATGDPKTSVPKNEDGRFICEACPNAQYGSDPRPSSNAQACRLVRVLFLLTPEDLLPLVVPLPPTSVGEANKFFLRLSRVGLPYYSVVTKIALEQGMGGASGNIKYSKAAFSLAERLEGEQAAKIKEYADKLRPALEEVTIDSKQDLGAAA